MSGKLMDSMPPVLFGLVAVGIVAAFLASVAMPSQGVSIVYGAADSGRKVSMGEGTTFKIVLDENPTTGYSWNESVTAGLKATKSEYVSGDNAGLMGAGGTHEWVIQATGKGEQQFSAVYKRPWEPLAGNETTFKLTIVVT